MKSIKYLIVLVCMTMGMASIAKAQIYSSEIFYYADTEDSDYMRVVRFEGSSGKVWIHYARKSEIKKKLSQTNNYYENMTWNDKGVGQISGSDKTHAFQYDYEKSTSARAVYKRQNVYYNLSLTCPWCKGGESCGSHGTGIDGFDYVGFSQDKSSYVRWKEEEPGEICCKQYYSLVDKMGLLPKAANYDFLND